jgi:hypothetical protein
MLTLLDVLALAGLDPRTVNVMLHSPKERELRMMLPHLAGERRALVEAYQATHNRPAETSLRKGRPWVAAFVMQSDDRVQGRAPMLFMGLYENRGCTDRPAADILAQPDICELRDTYGLKFDDLRDPHPWFHFQLSDRMAALRGRLLCHVRLTPSYVRLAEKLEAPVAAIHEIGRFETTPPPWRRWIVSAAMLRDMPPAWAAVLREWRGVYLIVDQTDGARYVGSAYGADNLLGRWRAHVQGDQGITAKLRARNPAHFHFAILERMGPDDPDEDVIGREMTWIARLDTRRHGLNA